MRVIIQEEALRRSEGHYYHHFIHELPTIDAVPVVRCRECKYHRCRECPMRSLDVNPAGRLYVVDDTDDDGFCHKGAKMDEPSP